MDAPGVEFATSTIPQSPWIWRNLCPPRKQAVAADFAQEGVFAAVFLTFGCCRLPRTIQVNTYPVALKGSGEAFLHAPKKGRCIAGYHPLKLCLAWSKDRSQNHGDVYLWLDRMVLDSCLSRTIRFDHAVNERAYCKPEKRTPGCVLKQGTHPKKRNRRDDFSVLLSCKLTPQRVQKKTGPHGCSRSCTLKALGNMWVWVKTMPPGYGPQVLVLVSISQGKPCWVRIFVDPPPFGC